MNFGMDYDGMFTNAPELWLGWVQQALLRGHKVYCVTMRYPSETDGTHASIDSRLVDLGVPVVATGRLAKAPFCESKGIKIDVWIDDNPQAVHMDAEQIWGTPNVEGQIRDPQHDLGLTVVGVPGLPNDVVVVFQDGKAVGAITNIGS